MSGPAYDLLLVTHILAAVVGFGAIAAAGWAASTARRSPDPTGDESVRRFFKVGTDWPARVVFLVPVLGLGLLFGGDRSAAHEPWPWIGLTLWTVAAGLATGLCWPAERRAQESLAALGGSAVPSDDVLRDFRDACHRIEVAAGAISICFLAAVVVMILQP